MDGLTTALPRTASFGPDDLQQFAKFYAYNAPVFDLLLSHLLGHEGRGTSVEARHALWKQEVEQRVRSDSRDMKGQE